MQFMILLFLSVFCATIPMIVFLIAVWWLDRYDREPIWLVGLTFLWGGVGAIAGALLTGIPSSFILKLAVGAGLANTLSPVLIAPLTEEPVKALILFLVVRSRHFDNVTDGFVYGAAAGLGFGMTENFLYFSMVAKGGLAPWVTTVVIRTLFSAVMHASATATVGASLGVARFRPIHTQFLIVLAGFAAAIGMHALWNGLIVASEEFSQPIVHAANFGLLPIEVLMVVGIFLLCVHSEKRVIRRHLKAEAKQGLIPAAHVSILTSTIKRGRPGWLEKGIPQGLYVTTATSLAFKLDQARRAPKRRKAAFNDEVARLRAEISRLRGLAKTT
jgi:RsiW-degrading membrane proteinase PrsW (M82 family)